MVIGDERGVEALLYIEDESLEVFALGMIDADGMVSRLVELMKDAHVTTALGSSGEDGKAELVFVDGLTATEGKDDAAGTNLLEGNGVEARVAFECVAESVLVLGEGRRVEDNEVVVAASTLEIFEGILAESFVLSVGEVESDVSVGEFDGACAGIDAVDMVGAAAEGIDAETTSVAEHVEDVLAAGVLLK